MILKAKVSLREARQSLRGRCISFYEIASLRSQWRYESVTELL